jgi:hypothetical protein
VVCAWEKVAINNKPAAAMSARYFRSSIIPQPHLIRLQDDSAELFARRQSYEKYLLKSCAEILWLPNDLPFRLRKPQTEYKIGPGMPV